MIPSIKINQKSYGPPYENVSEILSDGLPYEKVPKNWPSATVGRVFTQGFVQFDPLSIFCEDMNICSSLGLQNTFTLSIKKET